MTISRLRWLVMCPILAATLAVAQEAPASGVAVPSGPALAEGEVIILLQAKVPLDVIQKFVGSRGVSFVSSKESSKRILAAGGDVALVGTINLNQKDEIVPFAANGKDKDKKK